VRRLRPSLEDVTREVADLAHGRAGHLRIGCAPLFASHLLPAACTALLKDSPEVTLETTFLELEILLPAFFAPWRAGPPPCPLSSFARPEPGGGVFV